MDSPPKRGASYHLERRGRTRSVIVPAATSAARPIVSPSVGCGCTVSAMSSASAPSSIASAHSEIRSPACGPTMPAPTRRFVSFAKSSLVESLAAAHAERATARGPREARDVDVDLLRARFALGDARPTRPRDRCRRPTGSRARRTRRCRSQAASAALLPSCTRLVREQRRARDVADREDVREVRREPLVHARRSRARRRARPAASAPMRSPLGRRPTATSTRSKSVLRRRLLALERDEQAIRARFDARHLRAQMDRRRARLEPALQRSHQIGIGAGHQAIERLDDRHLGAERRVDGRELEPDDAAADHQQAPRHVFERERRGRVEHARVVREARAAARRASRRR